MIMALPDSRVRVTASHSSLLATGSIPVEGSSRNMTGGPPIRAMPALSFLLLPPLHMFMVTYYLHTLAQQNRALFRLICVAQNRAKCEPFYILPTCSCGPVYQHEAPAAVTSGHSPRSRTHTSLVFLWAWHTYSEFLFLSCGPTRRQTEDSSQCAAAPAMQR